MCQPKSQGGQRCAAHTRQPYRRVMSAISAGDEFGAAAEAGRGFERIRDYAMTPSGRPEIERDIHILEEAYYAHPSTSIQQETARQTTLATLRAAINIGDVRKEGITEAREAVRLTGNPIDVVSAVEKVSERAAAEEAALAAAHAVHHDWALTAANIPLDVPLPEHVTDPTEFAALNHRLANALPGDTFTVTAGDDTMSVTYDERFETDTGRTTYALALDTPTSHSEQEFISRDHITADVRAALFSAGAWADRRTATNPNLVNVLANDYNKALIEAAKPYTRNFDEFHAEYAAHYEKMDRKVHGWPDNADALAALGKETGGRLHSIAGEDWHQVRGVGVNPTYPAPASVKRERKKIERDFARAGVKKYLELATADEKALETARMEHRTKVDAWEADQAKREGSALRRLLPTSPRPALQAPETKTTPHPYGGMTQQEWVTYELENLTMHGRTDLSEFSSNRIHSPILRDSIPGFVPPAQGSLSSILNEPTKPDLWGTIADQTAIAQRIAARTTQTA